MSLRRATGGGTVLHVLIWAIRFPGGDWVDAAVRSSLVVLAPVYVDLLVNVTGSHYLGLVGVRPQTVFLDRLVGIVAER